jgi:hypothetical protein
LLVQVIMFFELAKRAQWVENAKYKTSKMCNLSFVKVSLFFSEVITNSFQFGLFPKYFQSISIVLLRKISMKSVKITFTYET